MNIKVPDLWVTRFRFVAGVLLVWGAVNATMGFIDILLHSATEGSRLSENLFCTVDDFLNPSGIFAPSKCYVYDRIYQTNPVKYPDASGHVDTEEVDHGTLVTVDHDASVPVMVKSSSGHEFDGRLVTVTFITGPLSGRRGMISRYMLSPRGFLNR